MVEILSFQAAGVFLLASIGAAEVTEIVDVTGGRMGDSLVLAEAISVDGPGNIYGTGRDSHNAFKIAPGDATGDGKVKSTLNVNLIRFLID